MPGPDGKIMHAEIRIGDSVIMMSETTQQPESRSSLWLFVTDCDAVFNKAVAEGATVKMPLDNMFWGERYGQLTDPFGHSWSLSMRVRMSPQEIEQKRQEAMKMFEQG